MDAYQKNEMYIKKYTMYRKKIVDMTLKDKNT